MIANLNKGGNAYGTIKYAAFKDGAYLLDTNMAGYDPAQLASEFEYFVKKNNYVQVPVFHASINFHPSDRKLTEEEYIDIASDLRKELAFDDNNHQYLLALHTDAKLLNTDEIRPHLHLIVNRVDFQGKCKNDYLDYINIQKALRKIEQKYELIPQQSSWEVEAKKGNPSREEETKFIQDAIKQAANDKPEMPTFISRLLEQNIDVQCRITRTGKLQGISYCYNDKVLKGRQVGQDYTHIGIQSKLGVVHKPSHKQQIELLIKTHQVDKDLSTASTTDSNSDDSNSTSSLSVSSSLSQQKYANAIAPTVRLFWQMQKPDKVLRGSKYDLELDVSTILVKRKSGEEIAQIPLDVDKAPQGITLNSEDVDNFRSLQQILDKHQALQQQQQQKQPKKSSGLEL
ncbi:MAG: relaxase/mobilization nuclease domain-containing protein [Calothrix sp. C42_A2020_038]|nr:relaxase/mobilization nuclease domain-containing protein [Calothrix sp. C42_A2020_038]